jgi:hypothetical protein
VVHSVRQTCTAVAVLAALSFAAPAFAQGAQPSQEDLRAQIALLKQQLDALQQKVAALEAATRPAEPAAAPAAAAPPPQPPSAETPAGAAGAAGPSGPLPVYGSTSALSKIFNPDIAVIGNFVGAAGKNDVEPLPGLQLHEAELSLQAIVDPYARADFFLAASPEGLEIEEGFITFPTLPGGLLAKVGKMKAQFGKANTLHAHNLPWVDTPMPIRNLLGGDEGLNDSGVSVSKLIPNPALFLEATGEVFNGTNDLFTGSKRSDLTYLGRLRGYRDLTESTNLDVGTSLVYGHNDAGPDSTTRVFGVDATFRYRPLRRALYRRLVARTELFWSKRDDALEGANAFGAYVSGEYQFARRWFAGGRYDFSDRAIDTALRDKSGSLLLTFWPSEFSQVRTQYRRTSYADGGTGNELLFQFLFSIGAHGAHVF